MLLGSLIDDVKEASLLVGKDKSKQQVELMCFLVENQKADEKYSVVILPLTSAKDEKDLEAWLTA